MAGMGGAGIAFRPDSTVPGCIFINTANPAAYSLIKLATLEVGGNFFYSDFKTSNSGLRKWGTNFSYGALGFPVRTNGGASFGIMPYSHVGYDLSSSSTDLNAGTINYAYNGTGGLNKVFAGYGFMPFKKSLLNFRKKNLNIPDSLKTLTASQYKNREIIRKVLSDFSIGANVNYIFGSIEQTTRVIYPNSILYNNTYRSRVFTMGDFTGNFGLQTAFTVDSVGPKGHRRVLKEKVKFIGGFFMSLNNPMKVNYDAAVYNYVLNGTGQEIIRDTVLYNANQKGTIALPMEQGFGIGFKKGERLNIVADFATTKWSTFKYLDQQNNLKDNYRVALGVNYIPEKYAAGTGAFFKQVNYRMGLSYNTGYIELRDTQLNNYAVTLGFGLPVGISRLTSMVNVAFTYGQMGSVNNNLLKENYYRINFGFTFSDRWFIKPKYD